MRNHTGIGLRRPKRRPNRSKIDERPPYKKDSPPLQMHQHAETETETQRAAEQEVDHGHEA